MLLTFFSLMTFRVIDFKTLRRTRIEIILRDSGVICSPYTSSKVASEETKIISYARVEARTSLGDCITIQSECEDLYPLKSFLQTPIPYHEIVFKINGSKSLTE